MGPEAVSAAVVIPVYNDEKYIGEAIRSVLAQSTAPSRFLVADNASSDATAAVAKALMPHADVAGVPENLGMAGNFQRAIGLVDTEFFAWLGSDDRLDPDFVGATTTALVQQPHRQAAVTAVRFIDEHSATIRIDGLPCVADADVRTRLRGYLAVFRWTECYAMYRRDTLLRSPGFRNRYGPDVSLIWWYLLRGPLAYLDRPLYHYREFGEKTLLDVVERIDSAKKSAPRSENTDLWFDLLREAWSPGVSPRTRLRATWELARALETTHWRERIDEDAPHARRLLLLALRQGYGRARAVRRWVGERRSR